MKQRLSRIKQHIQEHKTVYITGGSCLAIGVLSGFVLNSNQNVRVDQFNVKYKSPTTNNVSTVLVRRGHPGNMVKCKETGEVFASQKRAADVMGVSRSNLGKHLKTGLDDVSGYTFEGLGEATVA